MEGWRRKEGREEREEEGKVGEGKGQDLSPPPYKPNSAYCYHCDIVL